jgi:hypothetical protein
MKRCSGYARMLGVGAALWVLSLTSGAGAYEDHFSPRVTKLLSELTLDEKLTLNTGAKEPVYGGQAG